MLGVGGGDVELLVGPAALHHGVRVTRGPRLVDDEHRRRSDLCDDAVDQAFKSRIPLQQKAVRCRLDRLVDIGVVEPPSLEVPLHLSRRLQEIVDSSGPLALVEDMRHGCGPVCVQARLPEGIPDLDVRPRNGLERIVRELLSMDSRASQRTGKQQRTQSHHEGAPFIFPLRGSVSGLRA